jgi:glycerol uptake facilitator-like aquaporin
MNQKIKSRTVSIGAFCSGLVGGSLGTFKEWAANISPAWAGVLGPLLAALLGALVFSMLERRYVHPLDSARNRTA